VWLKRAVSQVVVELFIDVSQAIANCAIQVSGAMDRFYFASSISSLKSPIVKDLEQNDCSLRSPC
jgi:hypothetical protein